MDHHRRRCRNGARALPLLLPALLACSDGNRPIPIGLAGPFSDSAGAPMKRAAELAVLQINKTGGVAGRQIALVMRNDFGDADSAVAVAGRLASAGVVAVIGHVYSGTTLAAAPVYNAAGVVQISPSSSAPRVTQAGEWTFRVCPSDAQQAEALARFVSDGLHLQRGTILYLNSEYGRGLRKAFDLEFSRLGGQIDEEVPYLTNRPDVGAYFDRLQLRDHSEFVFLAGNQQEAGFILRQARARRLSIPFIGGDGLEGLQQEGSVGDGTFISNGYLADFDSPENKQFIEAYHAAYPDAAPPSQAAAATFDAVYLLRDQLAKVGTNRRRLRDAVADIGRGSPAFKGVTGTIAFDENGDVPQQRVVIGRVAGGRIRPVEGL